MCYLSPDTTLCIKTKITELVSRKKRFTGYDVFRSISPTDSHGFASASEISAKVRELFNAHDPCFAGYACFPIPGGGPLLYFYAGIEVLRRGQDILDSIRAAEATADRLPKNW